METNANSNPKLFLPLKIRIKIAIFAFIFDIVRHCTFKRSLFTYLEQKIPASRYPDREGVSTHDLTVDPSRNLSFRIFIPTTSSSSIPVIIYFHGGGFVYLSAGSSLYDAFCRRLADRLNAVVVSVNYRLAPEHKFPAQYDDAIDVIRFLDDSSIRKTLNPWPEYADLTKCFIAGDSAGGNIAHHAAVRASDENLSVIKFLGSFFIQPFFGGKEPSESEIRLKGAPMVKMNRTIWFWKSFLPDGLDLDHWACDVSGPNARDLCGLDLPPVMVVVGGFDPLQDPQRRYCEWLKENRKQVELVEYQNAFHSFNLFPDVVESSALIDKIKDFMDKQMDLIC